MYRNLRDPSGLKKVLNCSRRIGKTFTLATRAIEIARSGPGKIVHFGFPTQANLKNILRPIFKEITKTCPEEYRPKYLKADHAYYFEDQDSIIHLSGLNGGHAENLRGNKSDAAIIDEAAFTDDLDYVVRDILTPQLLTTGGPLYISSTPPRTPAHEFVNFAHQAREDGNYSEFTIHDSGYRQEIIDKFCKEAGGKDSTTWKREYLCQFIIDEELAIIPEFKPERHALPFERTDLWKFYTCYSGMDIGVRDYTVVLFGYYDFLKAKVFIEDELVMSGPQMTTDLLVKAIKAKEAIWFKDKTENQILRVSDNNDLLLIQDLGYLHKLPFNPTTKDSLDAMINELRVFVGADRLNVHPRCKHTIGCLKYGVWTEKKTKKREFARSKVYGHYDGLAALVYLVRNIDQTTNPIPKDHLMQDSHFFIDQRMKDAAQKEELGKMLGLNRFGGNR